MVFCMFYTFSRVICFTKLNKTFWFSTKWILERKMFTKFNIIKSEDFSTENLQILKNTTMMSACAQSFKIRPKFKTNISCSSSSSSPIISQNELVLINWPFQIFYKQLFYDKFDRLKTISNKSLTIHRYKWFIVWNTKH